MAETSPSVPADTPPATGARSETPAFGARHRAAVLLDYQNLHHYLKSRLPAQIAPGDAAVEMLAALRERLAGDSVRLATGYAYADFGGLDEHVRHVQRALYLHGIQPVYVPSTMHRNTTDLQLALDAMALRDGQPDLEAFVLISGDRDYVPVVQALQGAGRRVYMVAFRDHLSAHLLEYTRSGAFIDAETLLGETARASLVGNGAAPSAQAAEERGSFNEPQELPYDIDMDALVILERNFGQYEEVYLTPLLRKLSEELGEIEGHDPKSLVADLEACGAVRLERRKGMPYDYTVLLVNRAHPAAVEAREEVRGPGYDEGEDDEEPYDEYEDGEDYDEDEGDDVEDDDEDVEDGGEDDEEVEDETNDAPSPKA